MESVQETKSRQSLRSQLIFFFKNRRLCGFFLWIVFGSVTVLSTNFVFLDFNISGKTSLWKNKCFCFLNFQKCDEFIHKSKLWIGFSSGIPAWECEEAFLLVGSLVV